MQNNLSFKPEDVAKMDVDTVLIIYETLMEQQYELKKALDNGQS